MTIFQPLDGAGEQQVCQGEGSTWGLQGDKGEGEGEGEWNPGESAYALFEKTGKRYDIYHFALSELRILSLEFQL